MQQKIQSRTQKYKPKHKELCMIEKPKKQNLMCVIQLSKFKAEVWEHHASIGGLFSSLPNGDQGLSPTGSKNGVLGLWIAFEPLVD